MFTSTLPPEHDDRSPTKSPGRPSASSAASGGDFGLGRSEGSSSHLPLDWLIFFFGYLVLLEFGMSTPISGGKCHVYWPASGLFLSVLVIARSTRWPYFLAASFAANCLASQIWIEGQMVAGGVRAVASILEALAPALLLRYFWKGTFNFQSLSSAIGFCLLCGVAAPALYATLMESTRILWDDRLFSLAHWYLRFSAHAIGIVTVGAAVISLATDLTWTPQVWRRAIFFGIAAVLLTIASTFWGLGPIRRFGVAEVQLPLFVMPVLIASAIYVNRSATILIALSVSLVAILYTAPGIGPISSSDRFEVVRQSALQAFVFTAMLWPLIVCTILEEKLSVSKDYSRQFEHLQQVLQSSTDSIALKDAAGRFLLANEPAAKLLKTSVDAMVGKRNSDLLPPDFANRVDQLEGLAKAGEIHETVEEHWQDNGQERILVVSRSPWPREGSGEKGLVVIAREVTEIRRQKQALEMSERRFQALVDCIPICIFEADQFGACRYVNGIWTQLSGQTVEEAHEFGWVRAIHEQDRDELLRAWQSFGRGEVAEFTREFRLRKPDSSVTWVQVHIGHLYGQDGGVTGGIGAVIDITPRRYAVENLRESEELFRTLANAAPVMIWRTDAEGNCSFLNDRWLDFIGMQLSEAEIQGWDARIHPEDRARRELQVSQAFGKRSTFELDYRVLRKDGVYRWVADSGVPIFDERGDFGGFIGGCTDITDRHSAQRALQELNQQLEIRVEQRTSALTSANHQLQQEMAARKEILERLEQKQGELAHVSRVTALGEMAAGLAHELKQPLHAIRNYVSGMKMLARNLDQSSLTAVAMSEIDRETHRAAAIIDRIRSFAARSPSGNAPLHLEAVISDSIALMQSEAARRGVLVHFVSADGEDLRVRGDWIQIQQVLVNLIQNALDAGSAAGNERAVELVLRQEHDFAILECRDSGSGIAPEDQGKVFDAFFTRKPTGLGMGLAISRSIIEAHFGKIAILKTGPGGTTMVVTLPIFNEEPGAPTMAATAIEASNHYPTISSL